MTTLDPAFYAHVGLDFFASDGARITTICLVRKSTGTTFAIVTWNGGSVERFAAADNLPEGVLASFKDEALKLRENSVPQRFSASHP